MFGFFKTILRKFVEAPVEQPALEEVIAPETNVESPAPIRKQMPKPTNGHHHTGKGVELPLDAVLKALPLELQPRIKTHDVAGATIYIPLEKILSQLPRGSVLISFGELREAAPDVFHQAADRDRSMVPLPLNEIVSRIDPALLSRPRAQRQVEIPGDVKSPFEAH